jgi:hypothetical protein
VGPYVVDVRPVHIPSCGSVVSSVQAWDEGILLFFFGQNDGLGDVKETLAPGLEIGRFVEGHFFMRGGGALSIEEVAEL